MKSRLALLSAATFGFIGVELLTVLLGSMVAYGAGLSDLAPDPSSSNPDGAHVFFLRVARTAGIQRDVKLASYYVDPPNGSAIKISPGANLSGVDSDNVCRRSDQTSGYDLAEYVTVRIENPNTGNTKEYHISRARACDLKSGGDGYNSEGRSSSNAFYGRYAVPNNNTEDNQTNRYKLKITISLNGGLTRPAISESFAQRFTVKIVDTDDTRAKIAPLGGTAQNFSIVTDWDKEDYTVHPPRNRSIKIPFGLPCNAFSAQEEWVGLYDADNSSSGAFAPLKVSYQVQYYHDASGTWREVNMISDSRSSLTYRSPQTEGNTIPDGSIVGRSPVGGGTFGSTFDTYVVPDGESEEVGLAKVRIRMEPKTRYRMVVYEIAPRNTIDIAVPKDAIFGDIKCKWDMHPESTVKPFSVPGETVPFKHTVENTGDFSSLPVTSRVKWGTSGQMLTGTISTDTNRVYRGGHKEIFSNSYRIPGGARDGWQYCQYVEATPRAWDSATTISSLTTTGAACTTVRNITPPPDQVSVQPVVSANMLEVEPTETATFSGSVNISNFPKAEVGGWGFNEIAKYGSPIRQNASNPGYTATTTDLGRATASKNGCVQYTNPTAPRGPCIKWNWTCDGSSVGDFSSQPTCPHRGYKHVCRTYNTTNSSSTHNCTDKWVCPSPASTTPTYGTQPNCNVWQCPYGSSNYFDSASDGDVEEHCEKRCGAGSGPRPVLYPGDLNCYQPPSFSLVCEWEGGRRWTHSGITTSPSSSATSLSGICNDAVSKDGIDIGQDICSKLITYYPSGWSASVQPGWGSTNGGVTWRQIKTWGWNNFPSRETQACTEVVGKPTVKVHGGDMMTGSAFSDLTSCTPATTGSIVAWPRSNSNNYDASYTQLAAFAPDNIYGFPTAKANTANTAPPRGLAFANNPTSSGERYGGSYRKSFCAYDHYGNRPPSMGSINLNTLSASGQPSGAYDAGTRGARISSPQTIPQGKRVIAYVSGDVFISGDYIRYDRSTPWVNRQSIPAFKLVVYGGNIYIEDNVRELDGIYIAQPTPAGTGGEIYTCATRSGPFSSTSLIYRGCQTRLTVNGAFVAKKVHLLRSYGTALRGQTAETFNYLPELWTANWPQNTTSTDQLKYDALISLPPVL